MDIGLTTLSENDIAGHIGIMQAMLERASIVVTEDRSRSATELAGTRRRFVSTVSTAPQRQARDIRFLHRLQAIHPDDTLLTPEEHALAYKLRRGMAVGHAVADVFARQTELEKLQQQNRAGALGGETAQRFHTLQNTAAFVAAFTAARFVLDALPANGESQSDQPDPILQFDTVRDALKGFVATLDEALEGADSDAVMTSRARAATQHFLQALSARARRFDEIGTFEAMHIRLDADDFTLDGLETGPSKATKPLTMSFKKPHEVVGNHIAKHQAVKLSKMLMAYDFDRQMNPFVELGGFIFTFIGDGFPGTGKTTLIQMIAGLMHEYSLIGGYRFHYQNFGVDQISSYQGKSGQNCRAFIDAVLEPRSIGFGTIDDIDQVAAKRSDANNTSAGQQEITAVLMDAFSGANTVVRGNCSFGMFSNYPEMVDDALRQRAGARWLVDGPQSREDYVDIFTLLLGGNHNLQLGDHELYANQNIQRAATEAYGDLLVPQEDGLKQVFDHVMAVNGSPQTLADIGRYLHAIKQAQPRFTGRAIKNVTDAIKMRAFDVELPDEWFETPGQFMHRSYDDKLAMIKELQSPITMEMVLQEINRYAASEFRYSDKSDEAATEKILREQRVRERAAREMEQLKRDGQWNA
uniref:AAA family ATPase n=1 Tax=Pararhizobium sp. IMCC3301 TaxID=3067904 RepID=UPI0027420509|nr:AAA family ATPase [Pararhizobium sp. IMCC3301]